jgi:eukaryotic-like serine/threonine-protein kinase
MKAGDILNGYRILEDFKVVGAGLSKWTFAERGGRQYFIKEFLSPTYPDDEAPGSQKIKAKKRARCAAFEAHHRGVQRALAPLSSSHSTSSAGAPSTTRSPKRSTPKV